MREAFKARLAPFRNQDFRNFFVAQTLSLVGTWSHDLARSWIIVEATGSSGALGNLNMCIAVPVLFVILQAGVLVDRTDVRKLMQWTKSLLGVCAIGLALLTEASDLQVWHLYVYGVIEGFIVSFDSPAFQALIVRIVPRADFQQAIALNSTNFHTSRMIGPIVAAWLMTWHGPGLVFLFDGISYFVVAFVISRTNMSALQKPIANQKRGLRDGLKYIYSNANLRHHVMQLLLTLSCVYPLMVTVFRVYIQQKFSLNAHEFGEVFTFPAMGSMMGALAFAVIKPKNPIRALMFGVPLVTAMLICVPFLPTLPGTVAAISLTGFGLYLAFASLTVSMHLEVDDFYRGRMGSVIGLGFSAIGPLMSFPWGHLADHIGPPLTIWIGAGIFDLGSLVLALVDRRPGQSGLAAESALNRP